MRTILLTFILLVSSGAAHAAKGARIPLFFQTGDALYEIDGAPEFDDGSSVGYLCQRFALFFADIWTWDCKIMYVFMEEFGVEEIPQEELCEYQGSYTSSDRKRSFWNQYGFITLLVLGGVSGAFGAGGKQE